MVHAGATPTRPSLDGTRIAANAGAILFNGALLMLLLVPLSAPQLTAPVREVITTVDSIYRKPQEREVEPPRTEPIVVTFDQVKPQRPVAIIPPSANTSTPQTTEQVIDATAQDVIPAGTGDQAASYTPPTIVTDTGPLTGARLAYAHAPAPPYPIDALREGRAGTVILEVLVGIDGKPIDVKVAQSSGQRDLDRIAVKHVLTKWRFEPALRNGQPVQAIGRVPITFNLQ